MIGPKEIQEKEFAKGVRGYKEDEVNAFLDLITLDMDKLIQENNTLKSTIKSLNEEIERYKGAEGSIYNTLEAAKALMSDISASAEKKAEIVLKNAELDADRITKEARESVERLHEEAAVMTNRWDQFKTKYKNLLQNELDRFEDLSTDFLIDSDMSDILTISDKVTDNKNTLKPTVKPSVAQESPAVKTQTIKTTKRKPGL